MSCAAQCSGCEHLEQSLLPFCRKYHVALLTDHDTGHCRPTGAIFRTKQCGDDAMQEHWDRIMARRAEERARTQTSS